MDLKKGMILHLTLKKEWFDKIASGEKTVEYREAKPFWDSRFLNPGARRNGDELTFDFGFPLREYDYIIFKNGYGENVPTIKAAFIGLHFLSSGEKTDLKIDAPVYKIEFHVLEKYNVKE